MTSIARGSAASLDVVENAMTAGSLTAFTNLRIGTEEQRHRQEHEQDKGRQRQVERGDQPGQVHEHAQPAMADRVGDRRANTGA